MFEIRPQLKLQRDLQSWVESSKVGGENKDQKWVLRIEHQIAICRKIH